MSLFDNCREADESRLREVCESFLGPPTGMAEAASSDSKNPAWDPCVLVRLLYSSLIFYHNSVGRICFGSTV